MSKEFGVSFLEADHNLTQRVHRLADRLELPHPQVGVMGTANAFAVGSEQSKAAVVLGLPLIKLLSDDELDAVIGHELGHIATRDMHRMQVAEGYQQMFGFLFSALATVLVVVLAKNRQQAQLGHALGQVGRMTLFIGGELMAKGLSRRREYHADAIGAAVTSPDAMAGALRNLHGMPNEASHAEGQYGYLMFRGFRQGSPFATHPTVEERCAALGASSYLKHLIGGGPVRQVARKAASMAPPVFGAIEAWWGQLPRTTAVVLVTVPGLLLGFWGFMEISSRCWDSPYKCRLAKLASMHTWSDLDLMRFAISGFMDPPYANEWEFGRGWVGTVVRQKWEFAAEGKCAIKVDHLVMFNGRYHERTVRIYDFKRIAGYRAEVGNEWLEAAYVNDLRLKGSRAMFAPRKVIHVNLATGLGDCAGSLGDWAPSCVGARASFLDRQVDTSIRIEDLTRSFAEIKRRGC